MENASKALIMAGGILIAVFILSLAVYLFRGGIQLSSGYEAKLSEEELKKYNSAFTACSSKEYVLANEVASIANKIYSINSKEKEDGGSYFISLEIKSGSGNKVNPKYTLDENIEKNTIKNGTKKENLEEFIKKYSDTDVDVNNNNKIIYKNKFSCSLEYYSNGKVKKVIFYAIKYNKDTKWFTQN